MRITVVSGDRSVVVKVKGHSAKALARAEAAAGRLLRVGPEVATPAPFGYAVTTDHEPANQDEGEVPAPVEVTAPGVLGRSRPCRSE